MQRRNRRRPKKSKFPLVLGSLLVILILGIAAVLAYPRVQQALKKPAEKTEQASSTASSTKASSSSEAKPKMANATWIDSKGDNQLPILMFHYVSGQDSDLTDSNWMSAATFDADMKALKEAGYTTVTAEEAQKIITEHKKPSNKMVWLTFDDGSLTNLRDVTPILEKYDMHATAFLITGFIDNKQGGILSWDNVNTMKASGRWDFGSHTVDHNDLGTQDAAAQTAELRDSQAALKQHLGITTNIICYPAGGYNADTLTVAKQLGYEFGLAEPGRNGAVAQAATASDGLLTLSRFRMSSTTGPDELKQMLAPAEAYNASN
ncbi:polysaccharide deacetylase family protein [Lactococcus termiticola]|uniref:Xylanase/chitin deacetylase n=1 Tax=Lactococcus termiticola TaxID=2169526 RepID=A0A2R5HFW5_9LACT|nr:polysaccharide deacetylase family protein [Lactococcus termiticola]GBG96904.1 xylanase/chitin deacetylase [Lactococcus termiticola]